MASMGHRSSEHIGRTLGILEVHNGANVDEVLWSIWDNGNDYGLADGDTPIQPAAQALR